jgi:hypothetical protein
MGWPKIRPSGLTNGHQNMYRIRVKGHLSQDWSEWFDNMTVTRDPNGDTNL